ncbi:MAG: RNA-binding protein [Mariprofundus sp.]|nr:RNA-binding protein [Mariprofundus sp.]
MSGSCLMKLLAAAVLLALVGYFAGTALDLSAMPVASVLAVGLLIGCMVGGLLVVMAPKSNASPAAQSGGSDETGNIYVGNLPFNAGEDDVKNIFSPYGEVIDIRLVKDRRSKRFKGYGFVEMSAVGAKAAIENLDGTDYAGRTLRINEAKKKD